jgi:hypothetical protein
MKQEKTVKIKNEHLIPAYIENIIKILEKLSRYKSQQASFTYRHPTHSWLLRPQGYQPAIESRVLEKTLRSLGALVEVQRASKRFKRFIVKVQPIKEALKNKKNREKLYSLIRQLFLEDLEEKAMLIKAHSWKRWAS